MRIIGFIILILSSFTAVAQERYMTRNGHVSFESNAEVDDDVRAGSRALACVLEAPSGRLAFQVLIRSFTFKKALMQEHFNDNYMESDIHPKATYKGEIKNFEKIDLTKNGEYDVELQGVLTIRGIEKKRTDKAKLKVKDGQIILSANFRVANADYNIKIPKAVSDKVAEVIDVRMEAELVVSNR